MKMYFQQKAAEIKRDMFDKITLVSRQGFVVSSSVAF